MTTADEKNCTHYACLMLLDCCHSSNTDAYLLSRTLRALLFLFPVGGIYTVIRTKAATTVEELGDHYILLGPLNEVCMRTEVDVSEPTNEALKRTLNALRKHDIKVSVP